MADEKVGREAIETAYALKQIVTADVRIFTYIDDREIKLDSPLDTLIAQMNAFGAAMEHQKARQRTYDAMARKAPAGHVTGGRVYGYDNVEIVGADGKRSHVERRVNDADRWSSSVFSNSVPQGRVIQGLRSC